MDWQHPTIERERQTQRCTQGSLTVSTEWLATLPKSGRYPAKDVSIYWNQNDDGKVKGVEVVFRPKQLVPTPVDDAEFVVMYRECVRQWDANLDLSERSPENVFGWLVKKGFANNAELKRALEEFAHIEKCRWAMEIVKGFRDE